MVTSTPGTGCTGTEEGVGSVLCDPLWSELASSIEVGWKAASVGVIAK